MGSLDVVTDASGNVVQRYSFDIWGKRRQVNWTAYTSASPFLWQSQVLTRGYTFHEQLDSVDLVHMNGRVAACPGEGRGPDDWAVPVG